MHGISRYLFLSHLLYAICVKIFIMNRYRFKELENDQEYFIDRQYTERGQL